MRVDKHKAKATRAWKKKNDIDQPVIIKNVVIMESDNAMEEESSSEESDHEMNNLVDLIESSTINNNQSAPLLLQERIVSEFINASQFNLDALFMNIDTLPVSLLLDTTQDLTLTEQAFLSSRVFQLKEEKVLMNANEIRDRNEYEIERMRINDAIRIAKEMHDRTTVQSTVLVKEPVVLSEVKDGMNDFLDDLLNLA